MNKKKVLIITHSSDNISVDTVMKCIEEAGGIAVRFDVDLYPLETKLSTVYYGKSWQVLLETGGQVHDLQTFSSVWYRRSYNIGNGLQEAIEPEYLPATMGEVKRTLNGMLEGLPCFQMERYSVYRRLDSKEEQLKVAAGTGLLIPPTCISNDPAQIETFIREQEGRVVTKMQSSFAIYRQAEENVVFTNEIAPEHLHDLGSVRYCPMVFQKKIEKKLELRVTVVGRSLFAFSIDSAQNANAGIDWRKEGLTLINEWQPYSLPPLVQQQLLTLMDIYQLNYGAFDLILTPDNRYYFLEVNVAGEYFWLDKLCGHAISGQIAAVLLGNAPRRQSPLP